VGGARCECAGGTTSAAASGKLQFSRTIWNLYGGDGKEAKLGCEQKVIFSVFQSAPGGERLRARRRDALCITPPGHGQQLWFWNQPTGRLAFPVNSCADALNCVIDFAQRHAAILRQTFGELSIIEFIREILGVNARRFHCTDGLAQAIAEAGGEVVAQCAQGPIMPGPFLRDFRFCLWFRNAMR
jgi:hypothetical protein